MSNTIGWGKAVENNTIGYGDGKDNSTNGWGSAYENSWSGETLLEVLTPPVDPDAQAFITAAAITDPTQQSAVNQLVVDLKGYGVWTKMKALYPFVGGTASQHKFNLKDPRDLDAAFRLVFNGGWTHSSTGAQPNGVNGYADTFVNNSTILGLNNAHLSYYSRTNISEDAAEIGTAGMYLIYSYLGLQYKAFNSAQAIRGSLFTPTTGFLIGSRTSSTSEKYFHKGIKVDDLTVSSTSSAFSTIWIGNTNSTNNWSSKQAAFTSIGDGLTDTEASNFYTAVQTFQTALNRQIP
jgi:hypothetical protein